MDRLTLDLGTARSDFIITMHRWKYLFVGDCDGNVSIKLGSLSTSPLDPNEFDKLSGLEEYHFLYITNGVQAGKTLSIYFEEDITEEVVIEK